MLAFGLSLKLLCALGALAWAVWVLVRAPRTALYLSWGVFTLSLSALLLAEGLGDALGDIRPWVLMLSGGTCSVLWLFTRALFRKNAEIGPFELALVLGIITPSLIKPVLLSVGFVAPIDSLIRAQSLLSSTALILSVWEAARCWPSSEHRGEVALRTAYLGVFVTGVFLCSILIGSGVSIPPAPATAIEAVCAAAILGVCSIGLLYRMRHPVPNHRTAPEATDTDVELGQRLLRLMEREQLYLDPELNLNALARALGEPPNRVSRAITAGLKAPNVNQLINTRRIAHARAMLSNPDHDTLSILQVALESGFNSIGPFNRAFKAATDRTPRDYRREQRKGPDALPAE